MGLVGVSSSLQNTDNQKNTIRTIENNIKKQATMLVHCNAHEQTTGNGYSLLTLTIAPNYVVFGIVLINTRQMRT